MQLRNWTSLLILYAGYAWFLRVSSSIIPLYLNQKGVTPDQLILASTLQFLPMIAVFLFIRIKSSIRSWRLALIFGFLAVLSIMRVASELQVYVTYIFAGISMALFFIYYNVGHFLYTSKDRTGVSGGVMYAVSPIISILAPLLAGYFVMTNINNLWITATISFFVAYLLTYLQRDFSINYRLKESLNSIRSTRIPIFLEGIWEAVLFAIIPIFTLQLISTASGYGQYLSYLAVVGTIAGLLIGHYSDKVGRRSLLLWPICLILSLSTIALIYSQSSLLWWVIVTSVIQFMIPIFWNIITALVVDQGGDLTVIFPGREIVLALGRLLGLSITYILILNSLSSVALLLLAVAIILIPLYLYYQSRILKRYSYR